MNNVNFKLPRPYHYTDTHLLQFQQMYPQNLQRFDHLEIHSQKPID